MYIALMKEAMLSEGLIAEALKGHLQRSCEAISTKKTTAVEVAKREADKLSMTNLGMKVPDSSFKAYKIKISVEEEPITEKEWEEINSVPLSVSTDDNLAIANHDNTRSFPPVGFQEDKSAEKNA